MTISYDTTALIDVMPASVVTIPQRTTSKPKPKRKCVLKMSIKEAPSESTLLRPLPAGWVRQYDIIYKRYFYIDIRVKDAPISTWRFPPGIPIAVDGINQSVDIHEFFPPISHPPPPSRQKKIPVLPCQEHQTTTSIAQPQLRPADLSYIQSLDQMQEGAWPPLTLNELPSLPSSSQLLLPSPPKAIKTIPLPFIVRRKPVPKYTIPIAQGDFLKQLSELDLDGSEAANALLSLAFPASIEKITEAEYWYDNLNEKRTSIGSSTSSSSSSSSSSGLSFSDDDVSIADSSYSSSAWTLDL